MSKPSKSQAADCVAACAPSAAPKPSPAVSSTASPSAAAAILSAALLLPGVQAHAEAPPANGEISVNYMNYEDRQSGLQRTTVHSPSVSILAPVAGDWALQGTVVSDDVSGASPRYHTAISGASHMHDHRDAADVAATRYFDRGTLTVGAAVSTEHDYFSRALSVKGSIDSDSKNTSWAFGFGRSNDRINPVNLIVVNATKQTTNYLAGVTQILGMNDIVQLTYTRTLGDGYFNDPYKSLDNRPRGRAESALLAGWNHHLVSTGGTARMSYRYYHDSYGIRAHTLTGEYVQPLSNGWSVTPEARLYTQSAAYFYYDPVYDAQLGAPFPPGYNGTGYMSADQRLSGFGAVTLGLKVSKQLDKLWSVDVKFDAYQQRGSWRLFHGGSPGLDALRAQTIQIGVNRAW